MPSLYEQYRDSLQKIADVKYASAVLQWDQETYIPKKGGTIRGRQIATLSEIAHEKFTDEKLGALLHELMSSNELSIREKRNIELTLEDYNRNKKLPATFVRTMSETVNKSFYAWLDARKENSFRVFEKPLDELIQLKKQEADLLGYETHPYNALMNDYEKGVTVAMVDDIFEKLAPRLKKILSAIEDRAQVDDDFLHQHFDKDAQWKLGIEILKRLQFDFEAGRQDISEHPFTTNFSNSDVRVTTRIDENDFTNMLWSCIHEAGHALYEQGLPGDQYGLPLGEYCSLGIHESQSRLWENCVGRGLPFWQHNFSLLQTFFPQQFSNIGMDQFYKAINKVQPSLIRTEADELTYHFHVMIRYELEKMLISGNITTKDIPAYWNEQYKKYLDVKVPDDKSGCLQDVHWSHGSFGYFATYSLGSLYAAQFYAAVDTQNRSLEEDIRSGNNHTLLDWLRRNIHQYGRQFTSAELCKKATGENLNPDHFINYATKKYNTIYIQ
ncbi:MAG: carboxypeptidase M32 [Ferruginibacter sp.]